MSDNSLSSPISKLSGIGPRKGSILHGHGISLIQDLLYYFPRRYLDRTSITPIRKLEKGMTANLIGKVETFGEKSIRRGKIFQVIISDETGLLNLTWFNGVRFIKKLFKIGDHIAIHGKVDWYNGPSITHPEFDKLYPDDDPIQTGIIVPLYPLTNELRLNGIDQRLFRKMVREVFRLGLIIPEFFPKSIIKNYKLISREQALNQIHFADNTLNLNDARRRLKFEEHFFLQLLMAHRKKNIELLKTKALRNIGPYFHTISDGLNFELTGAQKRVIKQIHQDLRKKVAMNRLLQGDVGSGKTIVSVLITALVVGNNAQVAIMVPTEILASQHYEYFLSFLNKVNIPCALLLGNMKKKERQSILKGLKSGKVSVVIGTHALIQDDVKFRNLGMVVVDEQHRFGVNQRLKLIQKGFNPHFLAMTATPIPRTLSITYHGDMNLSIIDELPKDRLPVITKIVDPGRLKKIYAFIKKEVESKRQCMIIYPLIEESQKSDLAAAVEAHHKLSKIIFPNLNVGLIHGKMKSEEKDKVMLDFSKNKINVLVSTTVIEVGIDVPNATIMVIEHAERFGLTQLHQLRGRVGRGPNKSYCILVRRNLAVAAQSRLKIMQETNNGFDIANEDLKIRGPGEYFGIKQSGFFKFKIANIITDGLIVKDARTAAFNIIENDSSLIKKRNQMLRDIFFVKYSDQLKEITLS
ncbi:MAG: ATP-dependent DNA helicase RecG [Candidatus Marinimicrobia bacterium]|nr:ATP-dependent DNA helicase RecG [Candidatus Neomarinimicrobiota bacterium]|tara:strand:+ start:7690 stop:9771 length:2082 start_codon:yes stop_codon:yes gene_type:complete